jgi:S1-C subfamily serine protease
MILGLIALVATTAAPVPAAGPVAESVVHLQVYRSRADWSLPWRMLPVDSAMGSGFLIEGGRVITNAHVVADAREILVRRPDQANPWALPRRWPHLQVARGRHWIPSAGTRSGRHSWTR